MRPPWGIEGTARCDLVAAVRIHDQVLPRLCAVARVLAAGGELADELRSRLHDEMTAALLELRGALLAPAAADDTPSLRAAMRSWQAYGGSVELTHVDGAETPAELERLVCDVTAEAVRNALRHGQPGTIRIRVAEIKGRLMVTTSSRSAASTAASPGLGLGLRLADAAAARYGGTLDWGLVDECQWLVRLTVPVSRH